MRGSKVSTFSLLALAALATLGTAAAGGVASPDVAGPSAPVALVTDDRPVLIGDPAPIEYTGPSIIGTTRVGPEIEPVWADLRSGPPVPPVVDDTPSPLAQLMAGQEHVKVLADASDDEMGNPLVDFSFLSAGPTGFTMVRSGRPSGDSLQWPHIIDTALSYVRPHRNLEFVMSFSAAEAAGRRGMGADIVAAHAQLIDNLKVDVDSNRMIDASSAYGRLDPKDADETVHPGTMVAFGFDLGLLPAVLADVGISTTVTVGESTNPGPFIAVATNIELPNERTRELNVDTEHRVAVDILVAPATYSGLHFSSGFADDEETPIIPEPPGDEPIPIIPEPPVPEPSTMLLLVAGAAVVAARRRQHME